MYKLQIIIFISFLTALFSCEDVIQIDLNSADPQIVIDAVVTDQSGPYTIKINKTGDYFELSVFPAVCGAVVQITDDAGSFETLQETEPGIYRTDSLQGIPGRTYTLTVISEGAEYTATSCMPEAIQIDSLRYEYQPGSSFGPDKEEGYKLHVHFTDRAGIEDYCRFKVFKNGQLIKGFYLYEDKYTDGNSADYSDFEDEAGGIFDLNDTAYVELLTIDKATHKYYSTINNVLAEAATEPPFMSVTPANPNTNLSNSALGYFGAFTVRADSIIIQ
ncbi:MAG: DUF4249 domain-containing protein [Calditrichia bacterium]|nr:DUF4249 domain-containing protein [Calditrichia bacterium]